MRYVGTTAHEYPWPVVIPQLCSGWYLVPGLPVRGACPCPWRRCAARIITRGPAAHVRCVMRRTRYEPGQVGGRRPPPSDDNLISRRMGPFAIAHHLERQRPLGLGLLLRDQYVDMRIVLSSGNALSKLTCHCFQALSQGQAANLVFRIRLPVWIALRSTLLPPRYEQAGRAVRSRPCIIE